MGYTRHNLDTLSRTASLQMCLGLRVSGIVVEERRGQFQASLSLHNAENRKAQ